MSVLLWLYPRSWRRRYGAEMRALLRQLRGRHRLSTALDVLRGAADAHLHPQGPACRRRRGPAIAFGRLPPGSGTLVLFAVLVGLRFAADRVLALGLAHLPAAAVPDRAGAGVVEAVLGGVFAVLVLRRTRGPIPAFAIGVVLEVALGILPQHWAAAVAVEVVRVVLWAAVLAWLARGRRPGPGPSQEPPEGAPLGARPSPRAPEPLSARARRAS
jgi:hypothetical protein